MAPSGKMINWSDRSNMSSYELFKKVFEDCQASSSVVAESHVFLLEAKLLIAESPILQTKLLAHLTYIYTSS